MRKRLWRRGAPSHGAADPRDAELAALRESLRVSRESYHSLLGTAHEAFVQMDANGTIMDWNPEAERILGWPKHEAIGRTLADTIIPERDRGRHGAALARFVETGTGDTVGRRREFTALCRDGREIAVELTIAALHLPAGWIFNAFLHDISERRQRERYFEAQRRLAVVLVEPRPLDEVWRGALAALGESMDWSAGGVWLLDPPGEALVCNAFWYAPGIEAEELAARSRELRLGRGVGIPGRAWATADIAWVDEFGDDPTLPRRNLVRAAGLHSALALPLHTRGEIVGAIEFFSRERIHRDDGLVELMRLASEQLGEFLRRSNAERELAQLASQLEEAQELAEIGSWAWHVPTGELFWSDQMFRIFGLERGSFVPSYEGFLDNLHPDDRERVSRIVTQAFDDHAPFDFLHRVVAADGDVRTVHARGRVLTDVSGAVVGMQGTGQDITAAVVAEERLRETQKLESLGVLAGGVAHDFNNLLLGILGNASLARDELERGSELDERLEQIEIAGERAAELTRQMLAYSGGGTVQRRSCDLGDAVTEIGNLLDAVIRDNVVVEYDFGSDVPPVEADSAQLTQVLMNLLTNAADAIGEASGNVRVRTQVHELDAPELEAFHFGDSVAPGRYVSLEVADDGGGIEAETLPRIFDPFFTTKFKGRGLGLAAVLGIVRSHGGALKVESVPEQGTTFTVLFPAANGDAP